VQNVHIDNLIMDSLSTTENIERGNKELKKAAEKTSIARSAFFGTVVFCGVVFVWDWFI
jgi:syntaxin 18